MLLEVSCGSVDQALLAAEYGADRVELCAALSTGGVTPSLGAFKYLKSQINIPIFIMIAQPEANFSPPEPDFQAMLHDVSIFSNAGADGFVFGCITAANTLDIPRNQALVAASQGLPCTFHRAFDSIHNPHKTAQQLTDLGFARILTSGHASSADKGIQLIRELIQNHPVQILPGGGVRPENALSLKNAGATELHFSITKSGTKMGYLDYPLPDHCPERITQTRIALST
ncbi:MAG: copper homeostasis protein CutC [Fimbriimonadaceae bacterium]